MKKNILTDSNNILQDSRSILQHFTDKKRIILLASLIILSSSANILSTSALEYQSAANLDFTINPTITVSVSDLTISNLSPGSSSDSNIITVTASSNAIAGYSLSSTVGSTESTSPYYNYGTALKLNSSDNTNKFNNLGNTAATTLSDFSSSQWGYSYSLDSGTTWVSGNNGSTTNGYGGYETTSTNITHLNETSPGTSSISYKIGAKADPSQVAGEYTNIINFIALANPNPNLCDTYTCMQDYTLTQCQTEASSQPIELVDERDGQVYTVRYINGSCWMTRNLAIGCNGISNTYGSYATGIQLFSDSSNITDTWFTPMTQIKNINYSDKPYRPYMTCSSDYGAWYNYPAATAGTITSESESLADINICPSGWTLPTRDQIYSIFNYVSDFSPVIGGYYYNGVITFPNTLGGYWSSTATSSIDRYSLDYWTDSQGGILTATSDPYYTDGLYVRCVKK